jgi:hypothetical protein
MDATCNYTSLQNTMCTVESGPQFNSMYYSNRTCQNKDTRDLHTYAPISPF